jgi:hypothetical protein
MTGKDADGNGLLQDNADNTTWATVSIKNNGDVYIQPAQNFAFNVETQKCSLKINPSNLDFAVGGTRIFAVDGEFDITATTTNISNTLNTGTSPVPVSLFPPNQTTLNDIVTALQTIQVAFIGAIGNLGLPIPIFVSQGATLANNIAKVTSDIPTIAAKTTNST